MKKLIIIGAGGMGRAIYNLAMLSKGYGSEYEIKGFIDDNINALVEFEGFPSILNTIKDYQISEDDIFVNSMGNVGSKNKCNINILNKGGKFINLIHPKASLQLYSKIGIGCIILENAVISVNAIVGDFTLIQTGAIVGHDVVVGSGSRIDNYVVLVGGSSIGNNVTVHTGAIINHNVKVNNNATVGAGSFVIRDVKESTTVFGNPAKRL
jgi:sugar O-acyltransferase (sialic acid O-acetyltransferase NeuD family)